MTYRSFGLATALGCAVLIAPPAQAQYMAYCEAVIDRWQSCGTNMAVCLAAEAALKAHCKCHRLNSTETDWVVISGTMAESDVCGSIPYTIEIPPPQSPSWDFTPRIGGAPGAGPAGHPKGAAAAGAEAVGGAVAGAVAGAARK